MAKSDSPKQVSHAPQNLLKIRLFEVEFEIIQMLEKSDEVWDLAVGSFERSDCG